MLAILVTKRTKYACNHENNGDLINACNFDNNGDLIFWQSRIRTGPYMLAIFFNRDQICVQSRKSSWSHVTMISGRISRKQIFATIFGPYWKRLQAYMVGFGFEIASIFSPLLSRLHSYWVPIVTIIAIIFGPHSHCDCNLIWSLPQKLLRNVWSSPISTLDAVASVFSS